ncbi:MAG: YrhB domain-containing protein [Cyanobacteria bacterium P01_A01_bin.83]
MLNKEQAIKIIARSLPENMDIIQDATIETDYGWVFFSQTKKYIESGDFRYKAIGSGGTLVEKYTGNMYKFGSGFSLKDNLKIYELGYFRYRNWDIVIDTVRDETKTIKLLSQLNLSYVVPELAYGEVWTIPKKYSKNQLQNKIEQLPARFNIGSIYFQWSIIESYKKQSAFTYKLLKNQGYVNTIENE